MAGKNNDILVRLNLRTEGDFSSAEAAAKRMTRLLETMERQQREMAQQEAAAYREEAARNAKREADIRRMAQLEAQAYREEAQRVAARQRQIEELQRAEAEAYREQARRNQRATTERQRQLDEIARAEAAAYAEQRRRDERATNQRTRNLEEIRRAEAAAHAENNRRNERATAERQRQLDEVQRAERAAYAEQRRRAERAAAEEERRLERRRQAMSEVGAVTLGMGAAMAAGLALSVKAAVEWETAWTGVTKTVNGTAEEMSALEGQLRSMAGVLPVSSTEIANVAAAAGQLGIARGDVAEFTRTMIDMGVSTNLSSDEAATTLARMMNIMGTAPTDVRKLGSVIVDLGNNFATTEAEIAAMALRISGAGTTIGLSEANVLGYAAALSSVGIEAEAGGSAISTLFINMASSVSAGGEAVEGFAKVAGMSVDEFQRLFREDAAGAMAAFETGLGNVTKAGGDTFAILEDLGITEIRQRDATLRLANSGDLLSNAIRTANDAWIENNALTNEANKRYETAASRFQLAKNDLNDLAIEIGAELLPMVVQAADTVGGLASAFAGLPDEAKTGIAVVGTLGTAILGVSGGAMLAAPALARMTTNLTALGRGAGVARALTSTATFLAGPWGVAVAAGTVALGYLVSKHMEGKKRVDELTEAIKADTGAIGENTRAAKAQQLVENGTLETAQKLGLNLATVNDAYLGNADALIYLRGEYAAAQKQMEAKLRAQQRANGVDGDSIDATQGLTVAQVAANDAEQERLTGLRSLIDGVVSSAEETAKAKAEAEQYAAAMQATEQAAKGGTSSFEDLAAMVGLSKEEFKDLTDEMAGTIASFVDFGGAYSDVLQRKQDAEEKSAEASAKAAGDTSGAWKTAKNDVKVTFREWLAELEKQAKAQRDYLDNIAIVAGRVSVDTLQQIVAMGPQAAGLVADMVNGTAEEFSKLETYLPLATKEGMSGAIAQLTAAGPILAQVARFAGQEVADQYAQQLLRGEITVDEITKRYGQAFDTNIPDIKNTDVIVRGIDGSLRQVKSVGDAIRGLPSEKQIRVTVFDAQGNARGTTVTRNPDGTISTRTDPGRNVKGFSIGGHVAGPGGPTDDLVPAWLSDGEFVVNAASTGKHLALVEAINRDDPRVPRFATGGQVGASNIDLSLPNPQRVKDSVTSEIESIATAARAAAAAAQARADADSSVGGQGTAAAGGQGSGWQWQIATLRKAFPGLALNSGFRPGARTVSGNSSYHSRGRAVDVPPRMDVFRWLLANYGNSPEIIFSPAGGSQIKNGRPHMYTGAVRAMHFNHVHWAYDQGGVARGMGMMPKLTAAPERVLSPGQTKSFDRLVEILGGRFASGGLVSRGSRGLLPGGPDVAGVGGTSSTSVPGGARAGSLITGQDPVSGNLSFANGFDLAAYLQRAMKPVKIVVDDSDLRAANFEVTQWTSRLAMANAELAEATKAAEFWGDEVKDAQDKIDDAQSAQEKSVSDLETAQKRLTDATKALNKARADKKSDPDSLANANENYAEALKDVNDVLAERKDAQETLRIQTARLSDAQLRQQSTLGTLAEKTAAQEAAERDLTDAKEKATAAENALNEARQAALAYAQKIASAAMSGSGVVDLFPAEDVDRALRFARAAYESSVALGKATTDASNYQAAIDQVAAAGAKLATAQAAAGASYATQKATLAATRAEVDALARSYGFTAEQAAALADSAVPLANTGDTLVGSLQRQLQAVTDFSQSVQTLRALGLSQGLLDQILEAGPQKGLDLAQELISGGSDMVRKLNDLQAKLEAASSSLGQSAANAAYALPGVSAGPKIDRGMRVLRAAGGPVSGPGTSTSDSIPAYLSNGEYVIKAAAVSRYGRAMFDDLNAMRLSGGGYAVTRSRAVAGPAGGAAAPQTVNTGPIFNAPIYEGVTVRETVDADVLWQRAPVALTGTFGAGGGR